MGQNPKSGWSNPLALLCIVSFRGLEMNGPGRGGRVRGGVDLMGQGTWRRASWVLVSDFGEEWNLARGQVGAT